jgi:hypothetical protein
MQKFVAFGFGVWLACQMGFAGVTDRGALRAGAARVDITPPANPEYPASGKYAHERLYIRAIVLDNGVTRAALIGADQSGLADDVWANASRQIAEELSCPVVRLGSSPVAFRNVTTSLLNVESRSKMAYRYGPASGKASRNCWTTHSAVGW